jgi:hypothetical protein
MKTENQTAKGQYRQTANSTRGKPTIVGPKMTVKRKNNKVYYNWPVQPNKSWECKDVVLKRMKPNIDGHIRSNRLLYYLNSSLKSY